MKRLLAPAGAMLGLLIVATAQSAQFKFPSQTLTVPVGFEVEQVAGTPLVDRPVSASFDEQGRLYVTDVSGSNEKPDQQLEEKPHRVVRLEDTAGNGRFDKATVFADKMMFPEGCLWFDGSVYVSAPPSIWRLTDTNNDGVADTREEWHEGKTLTGCANDLHGPFLGPDGWIYWCKGAFATQTYERPGQKPFVSRAAHIFRARPDHADLEPVLTGGMDNPVGVAFTANGERILCGTFFAPHEPGHRDGLIHAIYGGVYGKISDVTDDHKKTGDLMPVMTLMGPAAPCSVIRYESRVFGDEYQDNLFVCSFNLHKVTRHVLVADGATFKTKDTDFLTSDNPDFHPTDVIEDADGSLLVINTGGWYKICCPTSQLSKPDVLGAIYRIRRVGARKVDDPRGSKINWQGMQPPELVKLLDDDRPVVVRRAIHQLAKRKGDAIPALADTLKNSKSEEARRNAVWALTQIDDPKAREAVYAAFPAGKNSIVRPDDSVAQTAIYSIGLWRDTNAISGPKSDSFYAVVGLSDALRNANLSMQRAAAEAWGRTGIGLNKAFAVKHLLRMPEAHAMDRVLEHSLIYALIELDDPQSTANGLTNRFSQHAALIALDQMDDGGLKAETVVAFLNSSDPVMRKTTAWVAGHHPDWGDALAGFFRDRLTATNLTNADRDELKGQLAQFAHSDSIQQIMASVLDDSSTPVATRQVLLAGMAAASLKDPPARWANAVSSCLAQSDEAILRSAVGTARALSQAKTNAPHFSEALLRIARDQAHPADLRLEALAALPNGLRPVEPEMFSFLCANVEPARPVMTRSSAASVLARARLKDDQLLALADTIKSAGPLEMMKLLAAFEHSTNEAIGLKLVGTLKESKGLASLRPDAFKTVLAKYPAPVQEKGKELLTSLNVDSAKQSAHIDELLAALKNGDIRRGQAIFNSQKAACFSCHALGYQGGHVGPDLTSIGTVRTERDLLESIVYPSASFVRSFEPFIVTTKSEESYSGILRKDAADEVVLVTGPNAEARIARADIAEMRPGTVSLMPAGLDEQLTRQELADLLAFLKSTKWGPK